MFRPGDGLAWLAMDASTLDPREYAFEALRSLALPTSGALARVQEALDSERKLTSPLRRKWHPTQHAACRGSSRFAHTVHEWGQALLGLEQVRSISTESQAARNICL
jgi:hypothetical protein